MQFGVLYANRNGGATTGARPGGQSFIGWNAISATGRGVGGTLYAQFPSRPIPNTCVLIQRVDEMVDFGDQYRCPTGQKGRVVAARMNREHEPLALWGLTKVTIDSKYVILDVGCGGGKTINRLAQLAPNGKVIGVDYSVEMVKFSKKINKNLIDQKRVEIIAESVEKMSFKDNFFDLTTAFEAYYFWTNLSNAFEEIKRVLKPGGKLLLVNEMLYKVSPAKLVEETHVKLFPLEEIQNVMRSVGFRDIKLFTKPETPWNVIIAQKQL